jgi:release factor glutamine methyltransferase
MAAARDAATGAAGRRAPGVPVRDALDSAAVAIGASGSDSPRLDAELLLAHALGLTRTELHLDPERPVTGSAVRRFQEHVRRRSVEHEPIAYLIGTKGFRHIDLFVDRRVLVPRPETELLVEIALALPHGSRVLDVGTGSGAVALAVKQERPDLEITGADIDAGALAVAARNRDALGLDVALVQADLLAGLGTAWDAVLSNPPYVAERDRASLPPDVLRHEPAQALFAGTDGLDQIRRLVIQAAATQAALLAIEVGAGQAPQVAALARDSGWATTGTRRDLAGVERVVEARRDA